MCWCKTSPPAPSSVWGSMRKPSAASRPISSIFISAPTVAGDRGQTTRDTRNSGTSPPGSRNAPSAVIFRRRARLPPWDYPRWTFTDYAAGVLGAFGALLGLYERAITGRSQIVDTSLVRATALTQILCTGCPEGKAPAVPRGTKVRGWRYSQQLYTTADGDVFVGFSEDRHDTVMSAFGVRHDAKNPTQLLADALARRSSEDVCAIVRAAGGGAAQVTSVAELMAPGGAAEQRGLRLEDTSCIFGRVTMPGPVVRFSSTPMVPGFFPGPFGSDRDAILARLPPD